MTGAGAYITATSSNRASIFDVVAQTYLLESLQPALAHVLKILAESNPGRYGLLYRYSNELFLGLHFALERHYLTNYGASFSENFYDLKRIPLNETNGKRPLHLPRRIVFKSLASLVVFPYIKHFLEEKYRELDGNEDDRVSCSALQTRGYVTGQNKVHSPLLHLCGSFLSYLSEEDFEYIENQADTVRFSDVRSLKSFVHWISESFGSVLQSSLEAGAFFLQFLDMFYSNNATAVNIFSSGSIPSPPQKTQQLHAILEDNVCPICRQGLQEPTALSVSGITFCYSCIMVHLKQSSNCPVTGYPATTKQLIKLYIDGS